MLRPKTVVGFLLCALFVHGVLCLRASAASDGRLVARPSKPSGTCSPGDHALGIGKERDGILYVPSAITAGKPLPLLVMLHGAGGRLEKILDPMRERAEKNGFLLLVPESRAKTWDVITQGRFGLDVEFIDRALKQIFKSCPVQSNRLAIGGFSDGATYALSLGVTNGHLFTQILAFSPGFYAPGEPQLGPKIFVSHGKNDEILPIERCGRQVVRELQEQGYRVHFREFDGGHEIPKEVMDEALGWFLTS